MLQIHQDQNEKVSSMAQTITLSPLATRWTVTSTANGLRTSKQASTKDSYMAFRSTRSGPLPNRCCDSLHVEFLPFLFFSPILRCASVVFIWTTYCMRHLLANAVRSFIHHGHNHNHFNELFSDCLPSQLSTVYRCRSTGNTAECCLGLLVHG